MKRPSAYYFGAVAVLNLIFGLYSSFLSVELEKIYGHLMKGLVLPSPTQWYLNAPWWPYALAVVSILGLIATLRGKASNSVLFCGVFVVLVMDFLLMFFMMQAYIAPFLAIHTRFSEG